MLQIDYSGKEYEHSDIENKHPEDFQYSTTVNDEKLSIEGKSIDNDGKDGDNTS